MKKKKFDWNHALTRKDFAFYFVYALGWSVLIYAALAVWAYWSNIKSWIGKVKDRMIFVIRG